MSSANPHRNAVLHAALAVVDGKLPQRAFFALVQQSDYDDRRLAKLIGRIEHLPSKSRLFGVGTKEYAVEMAEIRQLIAEAEEG